MELAVSEVAYAMSRCGWAVIIYAPTIGPLSEPLIRDGIPVISELTGTERPDLIYGNFFFETSVACLMYPNAPLVYHTHAAKIWQSFPPKLCNLRQVLSVSLACDEHLVSDGGLRPSEISKVYNYVDTNLFAPRADLPHKPRRALAFSNHASDRSFMPVLRAACEDAGLALDVGGIDSGQPIKEPHLVLRDYDIVFARGRAALEAMAVGCAVILCDWEGLGEFITSDNFADFRENNFGFRTLIHPHEPERLVSEIRKYDPAKAADVSRLVRETCDIETAMARIEDHFRAALDSPSLGYDVQDFLADLDRYMAPEHAAVLQASQHYSAYFRSFPLTRHLICELSEVNTPDKPGARRSGKALLYENIHLQQKLREQADQRAALSQDIEAEVTSRLATLTRSIEQMLSEVRLGAALADAQSQSAALQASLQKEMDARRDEAEARQWLQSRSDRLEMELHAAIEGRHLGEIELQNLAAQRAELLLDLTQERARAQQADTERLAVSAKNEAVEAQVAYLRVKLEQAETDAAIGRETSLAEAAAWVRERSLMEGTADRFKAEAKQTREHVVALERRVEIGRLAEVRAQELRGQMQGLTVQRQADARLQAQMLDDHVRRLYIFNHRADIIAEIAAARVRMQSKRLAHGDAGVAPRHRPLGLRETKVVRERLRTNGLFAPNWYRQQEPAAAGLDDDGALKHFLAKGLVAGRDPHPLVSMAHIARQLASRGEKASNSDAPMLALLDKESRIDPHPLFDTQFYLETNPDVFASGGAAFEHFIAWGAAEGRWPHAAFDPAWYLRQLPGDWAPPANPLLHYLTSPKAFYLDPHPLFDARRYLGALALPQPVNPLLHFVTRGESEGRPPHLLFEPAYYLLRNADVAAAGTSPFVHFLRFGDAEHRVCHPLFDPFAYAQANRSNPAAAAKPLLHYVVAGAAQNCPTGSQILSPSVLAEAMPDLDVASTNPLVAFLDGKSLSLDVKTPAINSAASSDGLSLGGETGIGTVETFVLPQRLREYVDVRFGLPASVALRDLMAVVDRFGDRPNAFALSSSYENLLDRMQKAAGHAVSEPDVSIIIPIHNALVYTLTCVVSVLESETRCSYEIIIGDDASTDATSITFGEGLGRIRVITHTEKFGFLANCNATAALARGRHLLFLNNDTLALPEWLDAMVDLADGDPTIGLVGSKLLNPDGTLQEAGGIVWNDGSAWNFGRGDDANAPAFNYVRDVDYCSGASILVPTQVWTQLDGFDRLFMPAYCEDSDFAFRAREAGYRTVYQPFSEIVHHEGRSHGRDENKGIKQYQTINANKLFTRWRNTLSREHLPNGERVLLARDRSRDKPHLLVIDHYVPQWDRDAGSRTMYSFLRAFVERGVQVIFWPDNLYQDPIYTRPLQELGIEVLYGPTYLGQFERWFSKNAAEIPYVLLSRPHISIKYIDAIKRTSAATILYYGHDLHSRRLQDEYKVNPSEEVARLAEEFGDLEMRLWRMSDVTLYPSESERAFVHDMLDGNGTVLAVPAWTFAPDAIDAAGLLKLADRSSHQLLFVGGFTHGPNVDGILWFVETVMPLLQAHDSRFTLTIVGSNAPAQVLALAAPVITILGFVDDATLADLYAEAGVAIAPLRFGGGVKGKVIEAFSKAIPVVTTPVGVQGVGDAEILAFVAETPEAFAAAVITAAEDHAAAQARVTAALAFVRREYTADKLMDQLTPTMPELARVTA